MKICASSQYINTICDERRVVRHCVFHVCHDVFELFLGPNVPLCPCVEQVFTRSVTNPVSCTVLHECVNHKPVVLGVRMELVTRVPGLKGSLSVVLWLTHGVGLYLSNESSKNECKQSHCEGCEMKRALHTKVFR